jgi:hypothetical protein
MSKTHSKSAENSVFYRCVLPFTPIFLGDFIYRLFSAPSKGGYLFKGGGWLDFIGSLPFPALRVARLFRMWRVYRGLHRIGMRNLWQAGMLCLSRRLLLIILLEKCTVLSNGKHLPCFIDVLGIWCDLEDVS